MQVDDRYRILIVEDGKLNREMLSNTLQRAYQLRLAETGETVLRMARQFRPHLILLDIILPDINGFEVLQQLKNTEETKDIPVIIITGLSDDTDEERGFYLGAVDYIRKPFNSALVHARVNTHIKIIKQMQTIEAMSFIDALTELPNRRKFDNQIEYEWRRAIRKKTSISVMMMDLDHFKQYNDQYGHAQGDVMLQAVGRTIKTTLRRATDVPCRWGGEEFAALLPETPAGNAAAIAEELRSNIEAMAVPCVMANSLTRITMSVGLACTVPEQTDKLATFIERADRMLYAAKAGGRNQVMI